MFSLFDRHELGGRGLAPKFGFEIQPLMAIFHCEKWAPSP